MMNSLLQSLLFAKVAQDPMLRIVMNLTKDLQDFEDTQRITFAVKFLLNVAKYELQLSDDNLRKILTTDYNVEPAKANALIAACRSYGRPEALLTERVSAHVPATLENREQVVETIVTMFLTEEQFEARKAAKQAEGFGAVLNELLTALHKSSQEMQGGFSNDRRPDNQW